uniref:Uncharacterized protein n=1 Tax=Trypanosoma vivax (strain Y486) TaxID=1055687 RepID=G0UCY1_TRYVY|nr:hypothetical protein TVY486_1111750 [Trypanosoma vivax Y486]
MRLGFREPSEEHVAGCRATRSSPVFLTSPSPLHQSPGASFATCASSLLTAVDVFSHPPHSLPPSPPSKPLINHSLLSLSLFLPRAQVIINMCHHKLSGGPLFTTVMASAAIAFAEPFCF